MTIQDALKELFYSLGGNADAVRDTDQETVIIHEIAKLGLGAVLKAAAELPVVSGEDDGKLLTVVDGAWAAAAPAAQLPAVTADDDDKVLTVVSGEWAPADLPT